MKEKVYIIDDAIVCRGRRGTACIYPFRMDLLNHSHKEFQQSLGDFTVDILSVYSRH